MNDLKGNRSFRVIVGAAVVYVLFRLWKEGWLAWAFSSSEQEGFGNADLILSIGAMLINFLELVGIATIGVVSGVLPELNKVIDYLAVQLKALKEQYKLGKDKDDPAFDWRPLIVVAVVWFFLSSGKAGFVIGKIKAIIGIEEVIPADAESAIIYLTEDATAEQLAIANSSVVDDVFARAGIERRMYYADQQLEHAEQWVSDYISAASPSVSSLIMSDGKGKITVRSLPDNVAAYKTIIPD